MVEAWEKDTLDSMADEQDMLEFFESNFKTEVEMSKLKILHAYHELLDGVDKLYDRFTKGMNKEQIDKLQEESGEDEDDSEWNNAFDAMVSAIERPTNYKLNIDVDEYSIVMTYHTKYLWIRYNTVLTKERPKLSEMEFEVELDDDAHFLIDLCNKLILEHIDKDHTERW
jgi:hypothetical protein